MRRRRQLRYKAHFLFRKTHLSSGDLDNIVKDLNDRINILCINAGRAGSTTLSRIWKHLPNVSSHHEPRPSFHRVLGKAKNDPNWAVDFQKYIKLPAMHKYDSPVYVETSHLFCKGFFEPTLELGLKPSFITLKRNNRSIAKSLLRLQTIPGKYSGSKYYLSPDDNVFISLPDWEKYTDYQLCYWYTLEINKRQSHYGQILKSRGLKNFTIHTDELNNMDRVCEMVETLAGDQIDLDKKHLAAIVGKKLNQREGAGESLLSDIDYSREEADLEKNVIDTTVKQAVTL